MRLEAQETVEKHGRRWRSTGDGGEARETEEKHGGFLLCRKTARLSGSSHTTADEQSAEEHAGIPQTAHSLSQACSRMEKTLSPPSPPHHHHHPQASICFPPPSLHPRVVCSHLIDFSKQPSSPAVDSAPASSKFHSVIFIFGDFFSLSIMFIHDWGSEREIRSRALSWPQGLPGLEVCVHTE